MSFSSIFKTGKVKTTSIVKYKKSHFMEFPFLLRDEGFCQTSFLRYIARSPALFEIIQNENGKETLCMWSE